MINSSILSPSVLGIDVGGRGIKGAPVDLTTGEITSDRLRIETPAHSTPSEWPWC